MREQIVYYEPTAQQRDLLYREPEARDIFATLSSPVQDYLYLTWQKTNPLLTRDERKTLAAQTAHMATDLFGEKNRERGYNRELQRYTDAVWMEVWADGSGQGLK